MIRSSAACFAELRGYLDAVPVIDTHEHYAKYNDAGDPLDFLMSGYFMHDFLNAGGERDVIRTSRPDEETAYELALRRDGISKRERYEIFLKTYKKTDKTAYSRGMREGLRLCFGVENVGSYEAFEAFAAKLLKRGPSSDARIMERFNIKARITNLGKVAVFDRYLRGEDRCSPYTFFSAPVRELHVLHVASGYLQRMQKYLKRPVACFDDYLECIDIYFKSIAAFGAVCLKDQCAYDRRLAFGLPAKEEAEQIFHDIISRPRDTFGDETVRPLEDWLFHHLMRKAAEYGLPVQIHTGHMAVTRNEITKTNAAHLIPVMELHKNVRFDLFHGNWPYMDEYLFIGKNYPNAWLNLCWAQLIDPVYCIELMKRAVMTVPQNKLFAFGGDVGCSEWAAGYLSIARDNTACALSELVESGWLNLDEAKQVARDWFFNNPNEFYGLGFKRV